MEIHKQKYALTNKLLMGKWLRGRRSGSKIPHPIRLRPYKCLISVVVVK